MWWGVWTPSAMHCCFCQSGDTFLTLHLEKSHCISSASNTPPGKSVNKELWWKLEEMFILGSYSSLPMDFLLQYWDLCLLAVFYEETRSFSKGRTEEGSCPRSSEQSLSGAICSLHTFALPFSFSSVSLSDSLFSSVTRKKKRKGKMN